MGSVTHRVLFAAWAPFFSGAERALLLTLRSLDPSRYRPFVLAGTDGEFAEQVRAMKVPCAVTALTPFDRRKPLGGLISIGSVVRAALKWNVSLMHANEAPSFQPVGHAARVLGLPAVTHVRFPTGADGYNWFLRPGFSRALFVSHALLKDGLAEAPELFADRSDVLHDGVEPQPEWTPADVAECRVRLRVPIDRTVVGIAGQIADVKGIWDFVAAASIVTARRIGADAPFFVVLGDDLKNGGRIRRDMEERVHALGLSSHFAFLGFRQDAPRIVQAFDLIAVPSHLEPLGNSTLEAMAAGRPVIGSRVGGIPEMVVDGDTGVLVPPAAPEPLADAIERLCADAALRSRMSAAARRRSREAFGLEAHGRRLQAHYDQLCPPRRAAGAARGQLA